MCRRKKRKAKSNLMWNMACVGAGLPAIQATRSNRCTEVMLSQASQLLQATAVSREGVAQDQPSAA
ncbi:hypothetical protein F7R12_16555 [Pseudomonas tolaasii]|nr:hypothetical protein F7R12_16555 [Pseudomonas tolaasii]